MAKRAPMFSPGGKGGVKGDKPNPADPIAGTSSEQAVGGGGQGYGTNQGYGQTQHVTDENILPGRLNPESEEPMDLDSPGGGKASELLKIDKDASLDRITEAQISRWQTKGEDALRDAAASLKNPPPEGPRTWSRETYDANLLKAKMSVEGKDTDVPAPPEDFIEVVNYVTGTKMPTEGGTGAREFKVWGKEDLAQQKSDFTAFTTYVYGSKEGGTVVYWPRGYRGGEESAPFYNSDVPVNDRPQMAHHMNRALEDADVQDLRWLVNAEITNPETRQIMVSMDLDTTLKPTPRNSPEPGNSQEPGGSPISIDGEIPESYRLWEVSPDKPNTSKYFNQLVGSPVGSPWPFTIKDYPAKFGGQIPVKAYVYYNPVPVVQERFIIWQLGPPPAS